MRLIDVDKLKFPNIAIFDMKLHGVTVPMVRLIDLQMLMPTVDAVPIEGLCDWMCENLDIRVWCDDCMKRKDYLCDAECPHMSREKLRKLLTELVEKTNE